MPDPTHSRKYGRRHVELRALWAIRIARGGVNCARCGHPITGAFDLGHTDGAGPDDYNGPEHIRCSRSTAGNGIANTQRNGNGGTWRGKPAPSIFDASRCSRDW